MRREKAKIFLARISIFGILAVVGQIGHSCRALCEASREPPKILAGFPGRPFQVLGPVGAGGKEILEARQKLILEAAKLKADALLQVRCESGGLRREGLNWYHASPYCRGMAIRFQDPDLSATDLPSPP